MALISGIAHVNLIVPADTLERATAFYAGTLGLAPRPVPHLQAHRLAWFDVGDSGQQVHIAFGRTCDFEGAAAQSSRHPCFRIGSPEALQQLQARVFAHFRDGGEAAPLACDEPGQVNSGESLVGL